MKTTYQTKKPKFYHNIDTKFKQGKKATEYLENLPAYWK